MKVAEFISNYKNHPILFVGTGLSLRYLKKSYTWDALLQKIALKLKGNIEYYLDLKAASHVGDKYRYEKIASALDLEFTKILKEDRNGPFKLVNDIFYSRMAEGKNISRLKIYISLLLQDNLCQDDMVEEIAEFKKIGKNVGSVITTNYDRFIESVLDFEPLIGNDILLSNPYGSVYKIHGCISDPVRIIVTEEDYDNFDKKYELVRAQLLSLFIHNPIIFLGYNIGDENIKSILKTIFTYVEANSPIAKKIKDNFLLVEYDPGSASQETSDHDIDLDGFSTIGIHKIKTDDYKTIYQSIANLNLPVSAMDIRKVQSIVKELYTGGQIEVKITENLDDLKNSDKIIAIGSHKTIKYEYQTSRATITNYFKVIDEENSQLLALIDKYQIQSTQYFPIYGFSSICPHLETAERLKTQQKFKLMALVNSAALANCTKHTMIDHILEDDGISSSNKANAILWSIMTDKVSLEDAEQYLRKYEQGASTDFRKLICAYDYKKYGADLV
ncbi:SIR2 family protein [Nitrosospira sp. NRS527]|uniref:SIR2 family protein n=1 Tax=Nitrosospira sp. NRS527 TaxID=155925 RepID=UPI001AF3297C|nr:SIR2 family protein [Nitrosospira sp. NRS527]BCT69315.1 hypothetical protein NNRS527_02935 [Nitrosospira sp. NRS527]